MLTRDILAFKESFHLADEQEERDQYAEVMKFLTGVQKQKDVQVNQDWMYYCLELLDDCKLKVHYDTFVTNPHDPWPHRYMAQDVLQAFVMMVRVKDDLIVDLLVLTSSTGYLFPRSGTYKVSSGLPEVRRRNAFEIFWPSRHYGKSYTYT